MFFVKEYTDLLPEGTCRHVGSLSPEGLCPSGDKLLHAPEGNKSVYSLTKTLY